ncbi:MAG TPA: DUF4440 domain-containing protein [Thermoanaerobaculia bacterium]|nr:DUF4440 domain-containing protein [Thermoanaerobaculia bacterium]
MVRTTLPGLAILVGIVGLAAGQQPQPTEKPPIAPPPVAAKPIAYLPTPTPAPPLPSVDLPPELDRVLRDYERAWAARNAEALARLFTRDGFVMSSGKPPVRGWDAIRRAYAKAGGQLALRALAFATEGSVGYIIGAFGRTEASGDTGKFILALRREADGRWMIAADMDNSNREAGLGPAPAPTAKRR